MKRYTVRSRSPSYPDATGEFYHPTEKRWIKTRTITSRMLPDGKFIIECVEFDFTSLDDFLGFLDIGKK